MSPPPGRAFAPGFFIGNETCPLSRMGLRCHRFQVLPSDKHEER